LLCYMLGDYAFTLAPDVLVEKRGDSHPTELADLEGKRMAIGTEVPRGSAWNEVRIKMLSGGDKVRARRMRQDFFEFDATHTFWVSGNDKPRIKGTDAGIWRRVRLVPFAANIADADVDPDLPVKLQAEAPGILSWALDGCAAYLASDLGTCKAVSEATDAYRKDEDILGRFIEDCCIVGAGRLAVKSAFREQLRTWLEEHEYRPISDRQLKADLLKRGIVQSRTNACAPWEWVGVGLRESVVYGTAWGN
jgi:putative DNA primase/helicase